MPFLAMPAFAMLAHPGRPARSLPSRAPAPRRSPEALDAHVAPLPHAGGGFRYPVHHPGEPALRPVVVPIVAGTVAMLVLLWALALQTIAQGRHDAIASAGWRTVNRAVAFEQFVARTFDVARLATDHLAEKLGPPRATGAAPRLLDDPVARNPLFAGTGVVDAQGNLRWTSTPDAAPAPLTAADLDALRADRQGHAHIFGPARLRPGGPALVTFARPVRDARGVLLGAAFARIPVARLVDFNRDARTRPNDLVSILRDSDGITLARRTGDRISWGENLNGRLPRLREPLEAGAYVARGALTGMRRIFCNRPIAGYGLTATFSFAEADMLAPEAVHARRIVRMMLLITLAILLFAALAVQALRRRESATRDLAGLNDRLREAQRIGGIGDWEYDVPRDRLVLSEQLCRMHGRTPEQRLISGREALAAFAAEDRRKLLQAVRHALAEQRPQSCDLVSRHDRRSASSHRIRIVPIVCPDGVARSLIGTDQDINVERSHAALRDTVAHGARVEAMNVMAATIAHELTQPLTAASNYLAAARFARDAVRVPIESLLDKARDQIQLAARIIERARDMAANRRGAATARVAEAVDDAVALLRAARLEDVPRIVLVLDPEAPLVAADKVQVQQVLLNLLRNAAEAVAGRPDARIVVASLLQADGMVQLSVSDNGPGIDRPDALFAPMRSAGGSGGLGLGLSICRTIVESYGGRIYADLHLERGARLCFTLPALAARSA